MALKLPEPPKNGLAIVRSEVMSRVPAQRGIESAMLGGGTPERLSVSRPHRIYTVDAAGVRSGRLLENARFSGWRYLVLDGTTAVAAAELAAGAGGEEPHFVRVNRGPFVAASKEALLDSAKLPEVLETDWEPRLLQVPPIHFWALWLHADSADMMIPLAPAPPGIEAGRRYSEGELVPLLQRAIKALDEIDDRPSR